MQDMMFYLYTYLSVSAVMLMAYFMLWAGKTKNTLFIQQLTMSHSVLAGETMERIYYAKKNINRCSPPGGDPGSVAGERSCSGVGF